MSTLGVILDWMEEHVAGFSRSPPADQADLDKLAAAPDPVLGLYRCARSLPDGLLPERCALLPAHGVNASQGGEVPLWLFAQGEDALLFLREALLVVIRMGERWEQVALGISLEEHLRRQLAALLSGELRWHELAEELVTREREAQLAVAPALVRELVPQGASFESWTRQIADDLAAGLTVSLPRIGRLVAASSHSPRATDLPAHLASHRTVRFEPDGDLARALDWPGLGRLSGREGARGPSFRAALPLERKLNPGRSGSES